MQKAREHPIQNQGLDTRQRSVPVQSMLRSSQSVPGSRDRGPEMKLYASEYLTMRLSLAEVAWTEAIHRFHVERQGDGLEQLKEIDLLAEEIARLKDRRL